MAKITKNEILDACIIGINNSFKEYLKWSGGTDWLWKAPEYFLTVNIAKELWSIKNPAKFITLEDNIHSTLKEADAKIKGKIETKARANGRSDILFWWAKGTPRGIIEVKNGIYQKKHIQEDLDRIYAILKKDSTIEFGVVTFYIDRHFTSGYATKKIETRIKEKFLEEIQKETHSKSLKMKKKTKQVIDNSDIDAAYAVAIMIYK